MAILNAGDALFCISIKQLQVRAQCHNFGTLCPDHHLCGLLIDSSAILLESYLDNMN